MAATSARPTEHTGRRPTARCFEFLPGAFQAFAAAFQRPPDRLRTGRQPALQDGQREADGIGAAALAGGLEPVGAVHLLPHVLGDQLVQLLLRPGQGEGDGVGAALGEQRLALEGQQLLLDHPVHQPVGVHRVHPVAEPGPRTGPRQECHEQLEVLLFPRVRGGRHQQQVPGDPAQQQTQLIPLGQFAFLADVVGAHPVRLVHHDQIPVRPAPARR